MRGLDEDHVTETDEPYVLTRASMDRLECVECGDEVRCDHPLVLEPSCHKGAGLRVSYKRDGVLDLDCATCGRHVALVALGDEVPVSDGTVH